MKNYKTSCPACGGPIIIHNSWALVAVCDFCGTAIGRTDRDVKDLGKFSEVGDPASGLTRGIHGRWNGKQFRIAGRVRYRHSGGGSWDEWYLEFPGQRCGWLAEAQGKFMLTHRHRLTDQARLPDYEAVSVGERVPIKDQTLTVREKGVAVAEGAEGEIPWALEPGAEHHYVDLAGPDQAVATFDYGDGSAAAEQTAYLGTEVTLEQLGIDPSELTPGADAQQVDVLQLNCPKCGGPLQLRAPDDSQRVACPNCTSLLDASEGKLSLLQSLHQEKVKPLIPLGSEGDFGGVTYTVIGFMERYAKYAGRIYPWTEYLLYNRQNGFRWLVNNDNHWSLVAPVEEPPTTVADEARYDGRRFRIFDRGTAYVRFVMGEFYWKVRVGDTVQTSDYIAPPRMLSFERSGWGKSQEVTISEGLYITPQEVQQAFGITMLPRPWGVGAIQPRPTPGGVFWAAWLGFLVYLLFAHTVLGGGGADGWLLLYAALAVSVIPLLTILYLHNFEVQRWSDSDYSPYASSD